MRLKAECYTFESGTALVYSGEDLLHMEGVINEDHKLYSKWLCLPLYLSQINTKLFVL